MKDQRAQHQTVPLPRCHSKTPPHDVVGPSPVDWRMYAGRMQPQPSSLITRGRVIARPAAESSATRQPEPAEHPIELIVQRRPRRRGSGPAAPHTHVSAQGPWFSFWPASSNRDHPRRAAAASVMPLQPVSSSLASINIVSRIVSGGGARRARIDLVDRRVNSVPPRLAEKLGRTRVGRNRRE